TQGIARGVLLPATAVSAGAPMAAGNDHLVPEFASNPGLAPVDLPSEDDRPADSRSEGQAYHVAFAPARAKTMLGPAGRISVVDQGHFMSYQLHQTVAHRFIAPRQVGAEQHVLPLAVHPSRGSNAHRKTFVALRELTDHLSQGTFGPSHVMVRCLAADLPEGVPLLIHKGCKGFGATDVNADGKIC